MSPAGTTSDSELETGWFVYGVVAASAPVPAGLTGVDEAPVSCHEHGRVAVLVSPVAHDRPPGRGADLRAYSKVLDTIAELGEPVAPVRFGSVLEDEDALTRDLLAPQDDFFAALLEGLRGRCQLVVQGLYEQQLLLSAVVEADPEIAELRSLTKCLPEDVAYAERVRLGELVARAVEDRQLSDASLVLDEAAPFCDAIVERPVAGLERVLDAALLVPEARREELEVRLERLAEELHPHIRLQLRGPMAPYDFVGGG